MIVVDSRPEGVYQGQQHWSKPGHIPGAINVPWTKFWDANNPRLLKPDSNIQALVDQYGIDPDKIITCYCGTGRKATSQFGLLKWYLGFPDVKLYEGSFTEWVAYPENPTLVGDSVTDSSFSEDEC